MKVLSVTAEVYPLVKTGGLADVAGALPAALTGEKIEVRTLIPGYPAVMEALEGAEAVLTYPDLMGGPARVLAGRGGGLDLFVLEAAHLYDRSGNPYLNAAGEDWPDNGLRFAALARAAADIGQGKLRGYRPNLIHGHDWQAALTPAYLRYDGLKAPPFILTIHNLAFQGRFPRAQLAAMGLPDEAFTIHGVEYYGDIGMLKAGILMADRVTTVSPTYAAEIASEAGGMGLGGLLQARGDALVGILNGLDTKVWDPLSDPLIARPFSPAKLSARAANKAALQERFGLEIRPDAPLFGVVSRLTGQKGLDLLLAALPMLLEMGAQLVLVGSGDAQLEAGFAATSGVAPTRIGCIIGYDEALGHQIQAGADALLVPSRFEPCGLTQLSALRYGAVPVVARTGGLADTVIDANPMAVASGVATGVQFAPIDQVSFDEALRRTIRLYRNKPVWIAMQRNGMSTDVSWTASAARYAALYRDTTKRGAGAGASA
jgi:starch synthase